MKVSITEVEDDEPNNGEDNNPHEGAARSLTLN